MPPQSEPALSRRERQIMDIVYARGQATALDVLADLPDALNKNSVRTFLRILEEKGHLKHRQDGQTYVYQPLRPRAHAGRSALRRVLDTFFAGSLESAVAAHLGDSAASMSPEELKRLEKLIQQARKQGERP